MQAPIQDSNRSIKHIQHFGTVRNNAPIRSTSETDSSNKIIVKNDIFEATPISSAISECPQTRELSQLLYYNSSCFG